MTSIAEIWTKAWDRDYYEWCVGFTKYRQRHEKRFKNWNKAMALYRSYQRKKYKSAYFYTSPPPRKMLSDAYNSENVILARIKKTSSFVGEEVKIPLSYKP